MFQSNINNIGMSNQSDSNIAISYGSSSHELRSDSAKMAMKSATKKLRRSASHKNPLIRYGYNEYVAHHYAYMMKVVLVCEPECFAEASQDAKWQEAMEEEMCALIRK